LTPGAHLAYLCRFELGRLTITQSFSSGGTSAALAGSGFGSHNSTGRLQKVPANVTSHASSSKGWSRRVYLDETLQTVCRS
jgi:hypothetical protein